MSGDVLLSHKVPLAVPSALRGLASGFGMGAGRFPLAMTAETLLRCDPRPYPGNRTCGRNRTVDESDCDVDKSSAY